MQLMGTPSEALPDVLATGRSDARYAFISLSAREPGGRDAEYIEWHSLDHRPEQHRLPELRQSLRLVSTPECRAARAASAAEFDAVDHVMTYLFTSAEGIPGFSLLGDALNRGGRMPLRLPSVGYMTADLAGKAAAPRAVAGADVIPWRPSLGVYLIIEQGQLSPASLVESPGVAGVWWWHGARAPQHYDSDARGRQITYCYLDEDPLVAGGLLGDALRQRWSTGEVRGLLAAPFYSVAPFEWSRHLPNG
jgi:hypothetical protein